MTMDLEQNILKTLDKWEERKSSLPESLAFYRSLLSIQSRVKARLRTPVSLPDIKIARERTISGRPLLAFNDITIDASLLKDTFTEIISFLSIYSETSSGAVPNPAFADLFAPETTKAWFEGKPLPDFKETGDNDGAFRELILGAVYHPFLVSYQEAWHHLVNQELWRRSYCPVCGGHPDLAFLDKERGSRWLLCSRCDARWLYQRLECPWCHTQDQNALAYLGSEKGIYRVYTCERCRCYLKAIDLRQTEEEILLPLERYLTLDLDIQAQKNGYRPVFGIKEGG